MINEKASQTGILNSPDRREKKRKEEERLGNLWDTIKPSNNHSSELAEGEGQEKGIRKILNKIVATK